MIRRAAIAGAAALCAVTPVSAQRLAPVLPRQAVAVDQIVADLVLGHCPMVLAGQFPLANNAVLTGMGFPAVPRNEPGGAQGTLQVLERADPQGNIRFAVVPGKVCQVIFAGPRRAAALARIKSSMTGMAGMGIDFRPAPRPAGAPPALKIEAFKALVAPGQVLNLHLAEVGTPPSVLVAQLFATAN